MRVGSIGLPISPIGKWTEHHSVTRGSGSRPGGHLPLDASSSRQLSFWASWRQPTKRRRGIDAEAAEAVSKATVAGSPRKHRGAATRLYQAADIVRTVDPHISRSFHGDPAGAPRRLGEQPDRPRSPLHQREGPERPDALARPLTGRTSGRRSPPVEGHAGPEGGRPRYGAKSTNCRGVTTEESVQ